MNSEADNCHFVNMHVYMHLAFKELSIHDSHLVWPQLQVFFKH